MGSKRFRIPTAIAVVLTVASVVAADVPALQGRWQGAIELPGQRLEIAISISGEGGAWTGTIDIPAQGARNLPLSSFEVSSKNVQFSIAGIPGDPVFRGILASEGAGEVISGQLTQGGQTFAFRLERPAAPTVAGSAPWKGHSETLARKPGTKPAHPLDDYAGEYAHPAYGIIRVSRDGASGLRATLQEIPVRLDHWHYETFRVVFEDPALANEKVFVLFRTNMKGDVDALEMPLGTESKEIAFEKKPDNLKP